MMSEFLTIGIPRQAVLARLRRNRNSLTPYEVPLLRMYVPTKNLLLLYDTLSAVSHEIIRELCLTLQFDRRFS